MRSLNKARARKWELEHQSNCRSARVGANFDVGVQYSVYGTLTVQEVNILIILKGKRYICNFY